MPKFRIPRFPSPWILWRRRTRASVTQIELHQPLILALLLVLLVWYIAAPAPVIATCLAGGVGLAALSFLWALEMARQVEGARRLEYAAMQVGDELEETITLRNASLLPVLWAEFVDRSNLPGYTVSSARALGGQTELTWRAHTVCTLRGVYTLGPWELRLGEPFGLFQVSRLYLDPQQILVYPPLAALPEAMLPYRGVQGDHRPLNQPVAADTPDGMAVRPYAAGDPLHKIHWRTTARRFEPYVKVFEPEAASRIWLVPDLDADVQLGSGEESTEETAVLLAASLAARLLQDRLAVGLFAGVDENSMVAPKKGRAHLWALLERLAPLRSRAGCSIASTLTRMQPLVSQRDMLVVITPSVDPAWPNALQQVTRARGMGPAEALLLDPQSFGGQGSADAILNGLASHGLQARLVRKGQIQALKGAYGDLSRWEFKVSATGKAIVRHAPRRAGALSYAAQNEENRR